MTGPFSRRRLRRLAAAARDVPFLEYVHAQPAQTPVFWQLEVGSRLRTYTAVAYSHYRDWCLKNSKTPSPEPVSARVADGGLGW